MKGKGMAAVPCEGGLNLQRFPKRASAFYPVSSVMDQAPVKEMNRLSLHCSAASVHTQFIAVQQFLAKCCRFIEPASPSLIPVCCR